MNAKAVAWFLLGAAAAAAPIAATPKAQDQGAMSPEMAAAFAQAEKFTRPGPMHQKLNDYVGKWNVVTSMTMGPGQVMTSESKAEFRWLIDGRFLEQRMKGQLMGMPYEGFGLLGHDNFKQAFVSTWIDNLNTYKLDAQGKLGQDGKTLIFYGPLDEYLTGENDKPVKYAYRWQDADHFTFEVHDLAIGETNTCVISMAYSRAK